MFTGNGSLGTQATQSSGWQGRGGLVVTCCLEHRHINKNSEGTVRAGSLSFKQFARATIGMLDVSDSAFLHVSTEYPALITIGHIQYMHELLLRSRIQ